MKLRPFSSDACYFRSQFSHQAAQLIQHWSVENHFPISLDYALAIPKLIFPSSIEPLPELIPNPRIIRKDRTCVINFIRNGTNEIRVKSTQQSVLHEHQDDMYSTLGTAASRRAARFASSISRMRGFGFFLLPNRISVPPTRHASRTQIVGRRYMNLLV
jgi:hypothetical protein